MTQAEASCRLRDWLIGSALAMNPADYKLISSAQDVPAPVQRFANLNDRISMTCESVDLKKQVFLDDSGDINEFLNHRFENCEVIPTALSWLNGRHIDLIPKWLLCGIVLWQSEPSTAAADELGSAIRSLADDDRRPSNTSSAAPEEPFELLQRLNGYADGLGEGATSVSQHFHPLHPSGPVPVAKTLRL